ncbi:nucleoside hydrolase [Halobacillus sp. A5]|uniref:nucleoside hydrolase n=1 Tax=Halobacillus sp. A5 TaxID=2880263 RepID=UPI0020A6945C|nr:nucleoside hydrolase [Halobacillus sp. A5]
MLIIADPGVDDAFALMYALHHPEIEVVGVINGYGNVSQQHSVRNTWYLLKLAGQDEIPIILGASKPLTGDPPEYFYDIHGKDGLGSLSPDTPGHITVYPFSKAYELIARHGAELTIVNLSRLTTLALMYLHQESNINLVKEILVMGGAFHVPGNVTHLAEANIYGDPLAAKIVTTHGTNLTFIPLNVSNRAIITNDIVSHLSKNSASPFAKIIHPIMSHYSTQYEKMIPNINGAPLHDVTLFSYLLNPGRYHDIKRQIFVVETGHSKGLTHADFRPVPNVKKEYPEHTIIIEFDPEFFLKDFIEVMNNTLTYRA